MENFTATSTGAYTGVYSLPQDGNNNGGPPKVSDVRAGVEGLANDVKYLRGLVEVNGSSYAAPIVVTRCMQTPPFVESTGITVDIGAASGTLAVADGFVYSLVEIPHLAVVSALAITIDPADNTLPTTKVRLRLYKLHFDGTDTLIQEIEDPATGTGYQNAHEFAATLAVPEALNHSLYAYRVELRGESGATTDPVVVKGPLKVTWSVPATDLGR